VTLLLLFTDTTVEEGYLLFFFSADLYSAIKTLEKLQVHYNQDNIGATEYEAECKKLISHCRTSHDAVRSAVRLPCYVYGVLGFRDISSDHTKSDLSIT